MFIQNKGYYGSDTGTAKIGTTLLTPQTIGMTNKSPRFSKTFLTGGLRAKPTDTDPSPTETQQYQIRLYEQEGD